MRSNIIQKIKDFSSCDLMKYRAEIFGFSAIWIVLFHICNYIYVPSFHLRQYVAKIFNIVNMGVDIFLLLSAYGLMAVCLIVAYSFFRTVFNFELLSKFSGWLGKISLEIYLVHVFLLRIINFYNAWELLPRPMWYFAILVFTIIMAKMLSIAINYILNIKNKYKEMVK